MILPHLSLRVQLNPLVDGVSKGLAGKFELFAKENKGMFRFLGVDCEEHTTICTKEKVEKYPTFRIYPAYPAPTQDYEEDTVDFDKLKKQATKFITSRVIEINQNNHDTFINDNIGKPKVLLFNDKKGTPSVYKAISAHFDKTLLFGLVKSEESALVAKYKVKTFPAIFMVKEKDGKPIKFEGQDFSY
jgi:DnaJ family protein C protein 16